MGRLAIYGAIAFLSSYFVINNAYVYRKQFYTACIHLTRSSVSLMVLLNLGLFLTIIFGKLTQRLFFGRLRALEHLYERSWFAVTETFLAMTIFRDEFDIKFITLFALLLFIKIFHWICQDRVDMMEASQSNVIFHCRMITVMSLLFFANVAMLTYSVEYTINKGPSMMIIFGFEYTLLCTLIASTFIKYILHTIDHRSPHPWEDKSIYIFYLDLIVGNSLLKEKIQLNFLVYSKDFFKLVTYVFFFGIVVNYYGLPLHIIRDLYMTLRSFIQRCKDLIQYRRATANMNERYPTPSTEELNATDRTCIICREEMEIPIVQPDPRRVLPNTPKKLPCGHIFHFHCLKSWLERQQSCPTCRRSVLEAPTPAATPPPPQPAPVQPNQFQNQPFFGFNNQQQLFPPPPQQPQRDDTPQTPLNPGIQREAVDASSNVPPLVNSAIPLFPISLTPLFQMPNFNHPPIQFYDYLTDEQLRSMEGQSRDAILARLRAIQSVQNQLTGVVTQLTQILDLTPQYQTSSTQQNVNENELNNQAAF
ncbi:E3 ubiquitin-protein ligase hrd1 [Lobulomyces angularis]|nr:E3 ubiquitin-protein ligase hrd1 [Lobulomyces angularis]